jgi:hypothetical protein
MPQCKKFTTPNAELLAQCSAIRVEFLSSLRGSRRL